MRVFRGLEELPQISNSIITIGSFDGVHSGHQKIIDRIKQLSLENECENYIITFHPHPRTVIYPRDKSLELLSTLEEKIKLFEDYGVDNLVIVPFTIEFSQISAMEYIEKFLVNRFNPNYIVIGYDHRFGINRSGDINLLKQVQDKYGFNIVEIPAQELDEITISSTKIREAIKQGDLEKANSLLNHPFELSGKVIRGRKLGTEIGFPTANIQVEETKKLIPMDGIYACKAVIRGRTYNGMLYIGDIPTIGTENKKSIEVNLFDFNEDIYGERVNLKILHFLRNEQKFDGLNALKEQLHLDRDKALEFFNHYHTKAQTKVSIAILNYNTKHLLEDFLPSVSYSSQKYEVETVFIDNASTDKSVKYVSDWYPETRMIEFSKNWGFAEGYNRALNQIDSEYTVLLNSDVYVEENWLDPLIDFMDENPEYAVCMPKILSFEEKDSFEYAGASGGYMDMLGYAFCRGRIFDSIEKDNGQYDDTRDIFWASGAAFVIRTDLYKKFQGLDKDFFAHMEEIDLCWRLLKSGYKIAVVPSSVVYHLGGGTLDYDHPRKVYLNFRNNLCTIFKNDRLFNLYWKIPARLFLDGIAGIKFLTEGKAKATLNIIKAHFSMYGQIFSLIAKRRQVSQIVKANRVGPYQKAGLINKSIVFRYFILGQKTFSKIKGK